MSVETGAAPEPRTRKFSRTHWLATGVGFVLVLAAGALAWTWRHPDVSFDYGYGMAYAAHVGSTAWTTLADSDPDAAGGSAITFTRLEPRFRQDGAAVEVEYLICELDPLTLEEDGVSGFGYGGPTRAVKRYCASTRPAEGGDLVLRSETRQQLLVGVTPTRPGRTVITGHDVTYRVGWQRGRDEIRVSARVTARR